MLLDNPGFLTRLNTLALFLLSVFLVVTEYLHYSAEILRREREEMYITLFQKVISEQDMGRREREVQELKWRVLMQKLDEIERGIPERD